MRGNVWGSVRLQFDKALPADWAMWSNKVPRGITNDNMDQLQGALTCGPRVWMTLIHHQRP